LIVHVSNQPQLRSALELDDAIYRVIAVLLNAELLEPDRYFHDGRRLDAVCAYIHMYLDEPIQLADLERSSGMSRRNLQYAFMREFSCSPMQWVRTERLTIAHRKLLNAAPGTRVTAVALSCGFDNLAMFSTYFKQRFGELPRQILKRGMEERSAPR
jgi:transcriptional regulator GlxA family with amidase domain